MQNKKRKGFTIVELVIVIAIVAVLAAVLIPTIGSLIKKANESADMQTVYQMNIIIAAESIEDGDLTIDKVLDILEENGFDIENLNPSSEDLEFRWDEENRVVILVKPGANNALTQIYPVVDGDGVIDKDKVVELKRDPAVALSEVLLTGGTFELADNMTLDGTLSVPAGITVTINLNEGVTLTVNEISNSGVLTIEGDGTLEINSDAYTPVYNEGTLTLENKQTNIEIKNAYYYGFYNCAGATANINNVNAIVTGDFSIAFYNEFDADNKLTINNATITVSGNSAYGIQNYGENCTLVVDNTRISVSGSGSYGVGNIGGEVTMGSTEKVTITSNEYCTLTNGGDIVVNDICVLTYGEGYGYNKCSSGGHGTNDCMHFSYKGSLEEQFQDICASENGGTLKLNENATFGNLSSFSGATIDIDKDKTVVIDLNGYDLTLFMQNFNVLGNMSFIDSSSNKNGTILMQYMYDSYGGFSIASDGALLIEDGIVIKAVTAPDFNYLLNFLVSDDGVSAENCTLTQPDYVWDVTVNTTETTVNVSLDSATAWSAACAIPSDKTVTIDTNGYTLTASSQNLFSVQSGGTLVITDSSNAKTGTISTGENVPFNISAGGNVSLNGVKIEATGVNLLNSFVNSEDIAVTNCNFVSGVVEIVISKSDDSLTTEMLLQTNYNMNLAPSVASGKTLKINVPVGKTLMLPYSTLTVNGNLIIEGEGTVRNNSVGAPFNIINDGTVTINNVTIKVNSDSVACVFINNFIAQDKIRIDACELTTDIKYYGTMYKNDNIKTTIQISRDAIFGYVNDITIEVPVNKELTVAVPEGTDLEIGDKTSVSFDISGQMNIESGGTIIIDTDGEPPFNIIDDGSLSLDNITICAESDIISEIKNSTGITCGANCIFTSTD